MQHGEPSGDSTMMGNRTGSSDNNHDKDIAEKAKEKVRYTILTFVFNKTARFLLTVLSGKIS